MRIHEIFPPLEPFDPIQESLDEDLKSIKDKAAMAMVAGSLALASNQARSEYQDKVHTNPIVQKAVAGDSADDADFSSDDAPPILQAHPDEVKYMALTMWGEARGHGKEGMEAIGHVIMNRLGSERNFGDTIKDVVTKRKQFSCWNRGDPNRKAMLNIDKLKPGTRDHKMWQLAQQTAQEVLLGQSKDPTRGALFYHTTAVDPAWADGVKPISKVANHVFYRKDAKA